MDIPANKNKHKILKQNKVRLNDSDFDKKPKKLPTNKALIKNRRNMYIVSSILGLFLVGGLMYWAISIAGNSSSNSSLNSSTLSIGLGLSHPKSLFEQIEEKNGYGSGGPDQTQPNFSQIVFPLTREIGFTRQAKRHIYCIGPFTWTLHSLEQELAKSHASTLPSSFPFAWSHVPASVVSMAINQKVWKAHSNKVLVIHKTKHGPELEGLIDALVMQWLKIDEMNFLSDAGLLEKVKQGSQAFVHRPEFLLIRQDLPQTIQMIGLMTTPKSNKFMHEKFKQDTVVSNQSKWYYYIPDTLRESFEILANRD